MPNIKSAAKAMRQSKTRHEFNQATKDSVKKGVREVRKLITAGDLKGAAEAMKKAMSALDKAAKKGLFSLNKTSRLKSRIAARLKAKPATT